MLNITQYTYQGWIIFNPLNFPSMKIWVKCSKIIFLSCTFINDLILGWEFYTLDFSTNFNTNMPWGFLSICQYTTSKVSIIKALARVAIPFSKGSHQCRNWTQVSCFTVWATKEVPVIKVPATNTGLRETTYFHMFKLLLNLQKRQCLWKYSWKCLLIQKFPFPSSSVS